MITNSILQAETLIWFLAKQCTNISFVWSEEFIDKTLLKLKCKGSSDSFVAPPFQCLLSIGHLIFPDFFKIHWHTWLFNLETTTMVMHFRGCDVFQPNPHPGYSQAPCTHFIHAYKHSQAKRAFLVAEDLSNPCVQYVKRAILKSRILICPPYCAFTIMTRAQSLVLSGISSF